MRLLICQKKKKYRYTNEKLHIDDDMVKININLIGLLISIFTIINAFPDQGKWDFEMNMVSSFFFKLFLTFLFVSSSSIIL